jgi:hypothetical protein
VKASGGSVPVMSVEFQARAGDPAETSTAKSAAADNATMRVGKMRVTMGVTP